MLQQMKVDDFTTACSDAHVYYDKSFQRRFGAWIPQQKNRFLVKLFKGRAHTLIVVADVRQCLEHSIATGQQNSAKAFQTILDRGYAYVSLDGQHRTKTILEFFNNATTITGDFVDVLGTTHHLNNIYWKGVPPVLQSQFMTSPIYLSMEVDSLYEELSQHFRDLNNGSPTNEQEDRNSYSTPIAEWIRAHRERWRIELGRLVKQAEIIRMGDDELLVKFVMGILRKYDTKAFNPLPDLNALTLDKFYTIGLPASGMTSKMSPYNKEEIQRAEKILTMAMKCFRDQTKFPPSRLIALKTAWALIYACEWADENDLVITDHDKFLIAIKDNDDDLIRRAMAAYSAAMDAKITAGEDPDDISASQYYDHWTRHPHQSRPRSKRRDELRARLDTFIKTNDLESLSLVEAKDLAA